MMISLIERKFGGGIGYVAFDNLAPWKTPFCEEIWLGDFDSL